MISSMESRARIYQLIDGERERQNRIHPRDMGELSLPVLGEEFGEVCKAIFESDEGELREELVHVAAVCVRWLEELDK